MLITMVFPAHAGMSLRLNQASQAILRFPRSRGDEPTFAVAGISEGSFSPLTRG